MAGLVNVDFADVRTVMSQKGDALMGSGVATGDNRAREAAEQAISSKIIDDASIGGATGVLHRKQHMQALHPEVMDDRVDRLRVAGGCRHRFDAGPGQGFKYRLGRRVHQHQVRPEGFVRELADPLDGFPGRILVQWSCGENAQTAGVRDRSHHLWHADPAHS